MDCFPEQLPPETCPDLVLVPPYQHLLASPSQLKLHPAPLYVTGLHLSFIVEKTHATSMAYWTVICATNASGGVHNS